MKASFYKLANFRTLLYASWDEHKDVFINLEDRTRSALSASTATLRCIGTGPWHFSLRKHLPGYADVTLDAAKT